MDLAWVTTHGDVVDVYQDDADEWRYRIKATNGEVVEQGSEGYTRSSKAVLAAARHHPYVADVPEGQR